MRIFRLRRSGAARVVDEVEDFLPPFRQRITRAYADGIDMHAASGVLKVLSCMQRILHNITGR